ncbi:retropepsin-like aspartic protease [Acetobacter oeni]|uniref:Peptidase A2 domain-containing protein n=1 Tax=Acetobacter oeni TaxID=304077 RepID=A0A511XHR0_9PROT|nr:retropepsin-like aspartic protease [Acetobacter oeni]MBB3882580.1 putative aspartyl protease [Acetobacter oeni]NHO18611.1 hypothetical protein [Acetobacter oeni]GBR12027.1 hypothetical protein AA21952_3524 [Acetobacter oeni LMG 21952]GEN62485.1 hypothetical protein AOE01nite_07090 [Acetobacter oeni]
MVLPRNRTGPRRSGLLATLAILSVAALAGTARAAPSCTPRKQAELPLRNDLGFLSAPVAVNGRTISLIIDTGSEGSLISPWFARSLNLPPDPHARTQVSGTGGSAGVVPNVIVASLRLGGTEFGPVSLPLGVLPGSPNIHPPVEGLLGGDILGRDILEIDAPGGRMAFWSVPPDCESVPPPEETQAEGEKPLHWQELKAELRDRRILLPVRLDGQTITALLDSGARSRIVSRRAAEAAGVTEDALAVDPGGTTSGVDGRISVYRWHRFHSLTVGTETERNPVLTVSPISEDMDMLLGSDWFSTHRVWISYRQGKVFVATVAGQKGL